MKKETMLKIYHEREIANSYYVGFFFRKKMYCCILDFEDRAVLEHMFKMSTNEDGEKALRFLPSTTDKFDMAFNEPEKYHCHEWPLSADYYKGLAEKDGLNYGHMFEKLVTELNGFEWKRDNVPFWIGADLDKGYFKYEIKFEKGTLITESTAKMLANK